MSLSYPYLGLTPTALDAIIPSRQRLYHPEQAIVGAQAPQVKHVYLWTPAQIDVVIDVTDVYERKLEVCLAHKSQFANADSLDWMKGMNKVSGEHIGATYAEAFRQLESF